MHPTLVPTQFFFKGVEIKRTDGSLDSMTFFPFQNTGIDGSLILKLFLKAELVIIDGIEYRTCDYWWNRIQNL
jgi:hypothetical protein